MSLVIRTEKKCGRCEVVQPLENFYNAHNSIDGKGWRCKPCDKLARIGTRQKSPGTRDGYRRRLLQNRYGLSVEQFSEMLEKQDGRCAICKTTNPVGEGNPSTRDFSFSVDHCHDTGKIRGLLCNPCNRGLGFFKDSAAIVMEAFKYLCERKDYGSHF